MTPPLPKGGQGGFHYNYQYYNDLRIFLIFFNMEGNKFRIFLAFLLFGLICHCQGAPKSKEPILSSFSKMSLSPQIREFTNSKEVNNRGGHLQGIQLIEKIRSDMQ